MTSPSEPDSVVANPEDPAAPDLAAPDLGVYLHWPFCRAKCPYCDFNSHVRGSVDHGRWRDALLAELRHFAQRLPGRRVTSVFFGGGTPSLMAPETVAALLAETRDLWQAAVDLEVTLEANPTSSEAATFEAFAKAGVNRLSVGIQSLDDDALKFLGRQHSSAEALAAVDLARRNFDRFSFDLIYARPGQSLAAWDRELARALDEGPEHISLYQLTIEEGTAFHAARRRGELAELPETLAARLFVATRERLASAGLPAYEISNHARPGAECRHNLLYWRYNDYVGVGPGAHGRLGQADGKHATRQHRAPEAWLQAVERAGHATRRDELVGREERLAELVMMGLRLPQGVARAVFRRETDAEPEALFDAVELERLCAGGFLEIDAKGLRATAAGQQRLDAVLARLLA